MSPSTSGRAARSLWDLIYVHNPFYLISALLVLLGLHASFGAVGVGAQISWMLMASLAGYTILVAVIGFLLVRFGRVWDDARTILLVLVLLFLALAASFDRLLAAEFRSGCWILALGFLFSMVVSEGILLGLRIRLPAPWRVPYYLILGLLFAYPAYVAQAVDVAADREPVAWRILLFSPIAGLSLLTLLPAARRGRNEPRDNGTPWPWPLFPWSLYFVLAIAIVLRLYFLSLSFDPVLDNRSTIQDYFFVPPLVAVAVVVLDLSVAAGWRQAARWCVLIPALLPVLALRTGDPFGYGAIYLDLLTARAGTPLFLTLWILAGYYTWAWLRGLPSGLVGLWGTLVALVFVGPATLDLAGFVPAQWLPLAVLAGIHLALALWHWRSWDWLLCGFVGIALVTVLGRDTWTTDCSSALPWHAVILTLLVVGAVGRDDVAWLARVAGALALVVAGLVALVSHEYPSTLLDALVLGSYELALVALAVIYSYALGSPLYLVSAAANATSCLSVVVWQLLLVLKRRPLGEGIELLAAGGLCLAIAAAISLAKAGCWRRLVRRVSSPSNPGAVPYFEE